MKVVRSQISPSPQGRPGWRGFTLIELLLVIAILALLTGIVLPAMTAVKRSMANVQCLSNLRNIADAFHQYAQSNAGHFPDPFANKVSWEASLAPYTSSSRMFLCPADSEVGPAIGASYDWRDTGKDETTLAGVDVGRVKRMGCVLVFDALPAWHARKRINAAHLDGSTGSMDEDECFDDLGQPLN